MNRSEEFKVEKINIYTDGACKKNPNGPGGLGIYIVLMDINDNVIYTHQFLKGYKNTTNNRMELSAIIAGLKYAKENNFQNKVTNIYSDSLYAVKGITEWSHSWIKDGRLTLQHDNPVKNIDLWLELLELKKDMKKISFNWIKAHTKIIDNDPPYVKANKRGNAMADRLARLAIDSIE